MTFTETDRGFKRGVTSGMPAFGVSFMLNGRLVRHAVVCSEETPSAEADAKVALLHWVVERALADESCAVRVK